MVQEGQPGGSYPCRCACMSSRSSVAPGRGRAYKHHRRPRRPGPGRVPKSSRPPPSVAPAPADRSAGCRPPAAAAVLPWAACGAAGRGAEGNFGSQTRSVMPAQHTLARNCASTTPAQWCRDSMAHAQTNKKDQKKVSSLVGHLVKQLRHVHIGLCACLKVEQPGLRCSTACTAHRAWARPACAARLRRPACRAGSMRHLRHQPRPPSAAQATGDGIGSRSGQGGSSGDGGAPA